MEAALRIRDFAGLLWLLLTLVPLVYLQQMLHNEIVGVFFLLTRRLNVALVLFSIVFFPGVLIHELSHWVMARILGVRTGKIWLLPERTPEGNLRMGYVETQKADFGRDALIGAAPLLVGGLVVGYAGVSQLDLDQLWVGLLAGQLAVFGEMLKMVYSQPDFWLWFYIIFVVSSMMLPSESDRRAWLPLLIFALVLMGVALFAGAGEWMLVNLAPWVNRLFAAGAAVFGISALVHILLLVPVILFRKLLNRITGLQVVR